MQGNDRWPPAINPSARLRAARVMPQWITARGTTLPPPPPPPAEEPPPVEPEYEVIEFPGQQTYSNQPVIRSKEKERKRCDLCGSSAPAVKCMQCVQQHFCYSCDEMYHRHPKRQSHVRKELDGGGGRPPLPPKGEPPPPPVPPPRRNKRATPRPTPTPPLLPPGPHVMQRESVSPKPGLMGSLKKIIGVRPQPGISHTMDRQNSLPANSSLIGFHDQHMMNCNGFPDWTEMQRGQRAGSFNTLNSPAFGHMMQAQSMAHLNCPGCHGHGMWSPWGGMPPTGTWQSSNFLNRGPPPKEEWSDSDSDRAWQRERLRRFSTVSARVPRSYDCDETQSVRGGRRTDVETSSHKGGRRRELDTLSNRGGRKQELDTMSNRGGRKQDFETMSNRGGRRQDLDTMSLRGGRRSDLENSSFRSQRKYIEDRPNRKLIDDRYRNEADDSESSDERESDEEFIAPRHSRKVMSDLEDVHRGRRHSQPPSPLPVKKTEASLKKKSKRNERFIDTGRRRSSPVQYKYESPSGEENEPIVENGQEPNEKVENGIETVDDEPEEEELGPIPDCEWECTHCTFVNEGGSRVCTVCCKTSTKPKLVKSQNPPSKDSQSPPVKGSQNLSSKLEEEVKKKLNLEEKAPKEEPPKNTEKTEKMKEKRGTQSPERNRTLTSKGTSPPPQSISTQTYEEGGQKLKRATSLADYSDWKAPQRSTSRQSLLSDTQSLPVTPPRSRSPEQFRREIMRRSSDVYSLRSHKRAGSQPPEYISTLVQKQVKQGLEMVKLLREAEEHQFSAEDLAVALLHCGDGDPIIWLQENWRNMIDTVVTLGTNYGQERKENTVGTISASEAREALRSNDGNVWAAVTECVEQRQRKYGELLSRGNFSREDIVTALTATHGNVEEAYKELNKNQLKPFLMRIWGPPQGADNDDGDFTKLAHGDMVGRGGKNSEEVSVDLSTDTNYERIQNWLEDHVYNSSKISHSHSMSQLGGLSRSDSDWRINPLLESNSNSVSKNRQNSDVQRFLKNFYVANNKSLFIKDHSISSLNLDEAKSYSNLNFPISKECQASTSYKQLSDNTVDNNDGEMETITIKLNPIIVKSEGTILNIAQDGRNRETESSSSEESESEESESEPNSESHTNEHSHDFSNTLKADQHLNVQQKFVKESSSVSECPSSEKSVVKDEVKLQRGITRSNSETSNESFESVHSSVEDNQDLEGIIQLAKQKNQNLKIDEGRVLSSRESSLDYKDYANILFVNSNKTELYNNSEDKQSIKSLTSSEGLENATNNITPKNESSGELYNEKHDKEKLKRNTEDPNISMQLPIKKLIPEKNTDNEIAPNSSKAKNMFPGEEENAKTSHSLPEEVNLKNTQDSSFSSNDSEEKFVEVSSDDEIPFIEETNENISPSENILKAAPVAIKEDDSDDDSNFHSSEVPVVVNNELASRNKEDKNIPTVNKQTLMIPGKKRADERHKEEFHSVPKSDSDVNDEQINDFSEESVDYNEGRQLSPITAKPLRRDPSLRFSEANSDKDISSIPTDSEKESYFDGKETPTFNETDKRNLTNELRNALPTNQAELLELLRKSLTKEDVVERLVSTLFATVLQASVETNIMREQNEQDNTSKQTMNYEKEDEVNIQTNSDYNENHNKIQNHETYDVKDQIISYKEKHDLQIIINEEYEDIDQVSPENENKNEIIHQENYENRDRIVNLEETDKTINFEENEKTVNTEENDKIVNSEENYQLVNSDEKDQKGNSEENAQTVTNEGNDQTVNKEEYANTNRRISPEAGEKNEIIHQENYHNKEVTNLKENDQIVNEEVQHTEQIIISDGGNKSEIMDHGTKDRILNYEENDLIVNKEGNETGDKIIISEDQNIQSFEEEIKDQTINFAGNEKQDSVQNESEKVGHININGPEGKEKDVNLPTSIQVTESDRKRIENNGLSEEKEIKEENTSLEPMPEVKHTNGVEVIVNRIEESKDNIPTTSNKKVLKTKKRLKKPVTHTKQETQASVSNSVYVNNSTATHKEIKVSQSDNLYSSSSGTFNSNLTEIKQSHDSTADDSDISTEGDNKDKSFSPEREVRRLLAEGLVSTYEQAEVAVQLKQLNLEEDMILSAAKECNSLEAAIAFLQQECQLCAGKYSVKEIVSMLECEHRCCIDCASNYFTLQITERNINDCVCPFCKEPDIVHIDEEKALLYFSHLDIFLKGIVKEHIHELFQRKLRDRTLMQDPNFKWCVKCSSGYIANPRQKRLMCPDCKAITCAKCMKPWEKEHEKMSCEEYKAWLEENDPDHQLVEKHLDENGVTCPSCKSKYILAKGGCMHLTCPQCKHEFCSGCTKPFIMGRNCTVSDYCEKLGLHSHHPRNCLFYLRDKEPEELEKLLRDNNIEFMRTDENETKRCGVQMLKETPDGLVEATCGYATLRAGLCRTHYIESLVLKVRLNKLDPVSLLDFHEALQELRRNGKKFPPRPPGMSEFHYRQICYKVIKEEIPLE